MIKTRLVGLLSHAKKYIVYTILWQWAALLSQVLAVFSIADFLEKVINQAVTVPVIERTVCILILVMVIRFFCEIRICDLVYGIFIKALTIVRHAKPKSIILYGKG